MKKPIRYMPVTPAPSNGVVISFLLVMAILMMIDVAAMVYAYLVNTR